MNDHDLKKIAKYVAEEQRKDRVAYHIWRADLKRKDSKETAEGCLTLICVAVIAGSIWLGAKGCKYVFSSQNQESGVEYQTQQNYASDLENNLIKKNNSRVEQHLFH